MLILYKVSSIVPLLSPQEELAIFFSGLHLQICNVNISLTLLDYKFLEERVSVMDISVPPCPAHSRKKINIYRVKNGQIKNGAQPMSKG